MSTTETRASDREERALATVKRSPEVVRAKDKAAWLALFTEDASIEDPVGAGAHVGAARRATFWDVFIAPQESITFTPRREFVRADHVIREVTIATVTTVSREPFALPAIVEYRLEDDRVAQLRAFWQPSRAVTWHAKQGLRGMVGLMAHGARTTRGLGIGAAMGFGLAMKPGVRAADATRIASALAAAHGGRQDDWVALTERAAIAYEDDAGAIADDPSRAWDRAVKSAPKQRPGELIVAGDHVACVLTGEGPARVALMQIERGVLRRLDVLREG